MQKLSQLAYFMISIHPISINKIVIESTEISIRYFAARYLIQFGVFLQRSLKRDVPFLHDENGIKTTNDQFKEYSRKCLKILSFEHQ